MNCHEFRGYTDPDPTPAHGIERSADLPLLPMFGHIPTWPRCRALVEPMSHRGPNHRAAGVDPSASAVAPAADLYDWQIRDPELAVDYLPERRRREDAAYFAAVKS